MSIKKSLQILLTISSMVPVLFVSFFAYHYVSQKLVADQTQNLQKSAESSKSGLETLLETQKSDLSFLAAQYDLLLLAKLSNQAQRIDADSVNILLQSKKENDPYCRSISLFNAGKKIIASTDSSLIGTNTQSKETIDRVFSKQDIVIGAIGIQSLPESEQTVNVIEVGCPIVDTKSKAITGYIVNTIDVSYFRDFLNSITVGKTGHGILLDSNSKIIYHPTSAKIGNDIESEKLTAIVRSYSSSSIPSSGTVKYSMNRSNRIGGYCVLDNPGWVLFVTQDLAEIHSIPTVMLSLLLFILVLMLLLIVAAANLLSKKLTSPIITLSKAMQTASNGILDVYSNIKSKNELGELSNNFNKMLHIINTNYEDLSSMHSELVSSEEQLRSNYDRIEFLAYHDTLTKLPNKMSFLEHVNKVLSTSVPEQTMHAVYFLDLDNFKTINDVHGHEYGDFVLVQVSQMLSGFVGNSGFIARIGGDEFLIFRENVPSVEDAEVFASRILERFKDPLRMDGESIYSSMSIGIALYPQNGLSTNVLIKNADIAMYQSKDTGKNKLTLFNAKMEETLNRHSIITDVLRNVIQNQEIYVQYQPLLDLTTNSIIGFEALMRIHSERLGFISPVEFIPIAEESGLINELSSWLIKEACMFNKALIDRNIARNTVSVNISSVQFNQPGFVQLLSNVLAETGLPPQYLELEITESTLLSSIMDTNILLSQLQKLGVKVSLDDFGTGYSSLNYLTKLPINTLKIDKSFIDNICTNEKDSCIAKSIIQLAHRLKIKVVAEGVEDENQLALLRRQKCDVIQGFIFSAPLHPPALVNVLQGI